MFRQRTFTLQCRRAVKVLLGQQDFGEEAEERVVEAFCLHAAALHQRVDDSAHENTVYRLGRRDEQVTIQFQETCGA